MDELLVKKAQKGDKESFAAIILEVMEKAYKIAYCYLHSDQDSMDAVCNAVEKALLNIKKLKQSEFFTTWFIRIVINECNIQKRKNNRFFNSIHRLSIQEFESNNKEELMDIEIMLNKLSVEDRALIQMKFYLGYSLDEIADVTGLPVGTVKTKIYNNLKKIKGKLEIKEVSYE